jgi:hypothetical protein
MKRCKGRCLTLAISQGKVGEARSFRTGNNSDPTSLRAEVCAFPGQSERYCVCFIDIINCTIQTAPLSGVRYREYIGPFLNKMALIARNFAAEVTFIFLRHLMPRILIHLEMYLNAALQ